MPSLLLPQSSSSSSPPSLSRLSAPGVVVIAGTDKECGKTALAEACLRLLPGAAGVKVTRVHEGKCPTGDDCGACDSLRGPFEIFSDESHPDEIAKKGTDTARLAAASGGPSYWVKTRREFAPQAFAALLDTTAVRGFSRLVIESNTFWHLSDPGLGLLIARWPVPNPKAGVSDLFPRADLLLEWGETPNLAGLAFPAARARIAAPGFAELREIISPRLEDWKRSAVKLPG